MISAPTFACDSSNTAARVHLAAFTTVRLAESPQCERPFVQAFAGLAEWVLGTLVRAGDAAVHRD
jgi:hypothetical protein